VVERKRLSAKSGGVYFDNDPALFFSSGCALLDCVLGGGWARRRTVNVVGDKSTGKTLLAIESIPNFYAVCPDAEVTYAECESAFDPHYAKSLGVPLDKVRFPKFDTVEKLFKDLEELTKSKPKNHLYIVDSLDALSTETEMEREIDASTFGAEKARQLSQLFRRITQPLEQCGVTLMIISQVRDNIGVTFGKSDTRSGGRALDFYCSQVLWLTHKKRIASIKKGVERTVGVEVKAKCEKNKVGMPFRECQFPIYFGYGVEDVEAGAQWLSTITGGLETLSDLNGDAKLALADFWKRADKMNDEEYKMLKGQVAERVKVVWEEIEERFKMPRKKY